MGFGRQLHQVCGSAEIGAVEKDPAKRMDLYAQAEKILLYDEAAITPLYWYSSPVLIQPYVKSIDSITGYDHYEKWDISQ
jgi:oligopeptide transport system substrate-binding protein